MAILDAPSAGEPTLAVGPAPVPGSTAVAEAGPAAGPRIDLAPYDATAALALERELGVSHVLAQILVRRGFADSASARRFLDAPERHEPSAFSGIEAALATIRAALRDGRRITVHGDYDVDGVCATVVMVRALRALGGEVDWYLPDRIADGYGLAAATVQRLVERGTGLIVTVDCAITAVEEVAAARAAGLDVVVTDHHAPRADGRLPDCPIVHPTLGGYPCPDLCGTAVAYKLALALQAPTAEEELELVALATVADLVGLVGENRRLVREGLRALATTGRPGLRALMAVAQVDPGALDTSTLGFRLAPRINAAGRLARADAGVELLVSPDPGRTRQIAAELDAVNGERRAVEQRIGWEVEEQVRAQQQRVQAAGAPPPSAYVLVGEGWHPGVVGIVASRVVERHHRPTVVLAQDTAAGIATGSARSIPGFDLLQALHACARHLDRYGGHRAAAGLSLPLTAVDAFRERLDAHAAEHLTPELLTPVQRIDAVVSGGELGLELAEELEALQPCGMGNPAPRLLLTGARLQDVRPMGEGRHARFTIVSGGARAKGVAFGCEGRVDPADGGPVDACVRLERNSWRGAVEPRIVLRHAQACTPPPIARLTEEPEYLGAVLAELEAALDGAASGGDPAAGADRSAGDLSAGGAPSAGGQRTMLDRRGESPLAVLADARAAGSSVLALCADVERRLTGLATRTGGFTLAAYGDLLADDAAQALHAFDQIVALDPPTSPAQAALLATGRGMTHWAWGPAELRFSEQMHEQEYALRTSLVALYRSLRERERATGEELEQLLRGDGPHGRSARLAGRLIRVLAELSLVSLDRDLPALAIAGRAPTALDHSPSFRVYAKRYEDGKRFLSSMSPPGPG